MCVRQKLNIHEVESNQLMRHPETMSGLEEKVRSIRRGASELSIKSNETRKAAIESMAEAILRRKAEIIDANNEDLERAEKAGIPSSILHRLKFSEDKIASAVKGLRELASLPDPVGKVREARELDEGFVLKKVTFPIGVIAMIFEARPDALVQIAGLCLRSGNAVVLKGGKEAENTNRVLVKVIAEATESIVNSSWILGIESHADVDTLLTLDKDIDLIIPRGSNKFVSYVMDHTHIPVIGHSDGICSVYVDESADINMAVRIIIDSKTQYPAACNAAETILVHERIAPELLPELRKAFKACGVIVHADEKSRVYIPDAIPATEDDFHTEYLSLECALKIVRSIDEAISHIAEHGSHHTDSIVTGSEESKARFFREVDSADVFCNCSTRFADGFRFGLGAEVGISTSKIHARGPVGLEGLMTTKWLLSGHGEIVADYSGPDGKNFKHKELCNA